MLSINPNDFAQHGNAGGRWRRALLIGERSAVNLQQQLEASGYETLTATATDAPRVITEWTPDLAIIVLQRSKDGDSDSLALARTLRAEAGTYALPLVFVWYEDARSRRSAALSVGADDYFALSTPLPEILARLDALFWRCEAGRRSPSVIGDQRLEIDNFMMLLGCVGEDIRAGANGTLALAYAVPKHKGNGRLDKHARDRTLARAYSLLKLNLRRADSVAFYGPTTLLIYLPRMDASAAGAALSNIHRDFSTLSADGELIFGLASFPDDGSDVEKLVERAEEAVSVARADSIRGRVVAFRAKEMTDTARTITLGEGAPTDVAAMNEAATPLARPARSEKTVTLNGGSDLRPKIADRHPAVNSSEVVAGGRERGAGSAAAATPRRLLLTASNPVRMAQLNSLIRSAGYEARAAFDGRQALSLLRIEPLDLLLLDCETDGTDGLEMLRRLREQSGGRLAPPVVLLLSSENESVCKQALEIGVSRVMTMPYDPADLLAEVRGALGDCLEG